jgi:hypothetical protein
MRRLTDEERNLLEEKLEKYERLRDRTHEPDHGGYAAEEVETITRRLALIRETLKRGWTLAEPGEHLYE